MDELLLLGALIIVHLLADFYLQPLNWIQDRQRRHYHSYKLFFHALVHTILALIILMVWEFYYGWGDNLTQSLWLAMALGLSHYLIDLIKSYCPKNLWFFLLDQALHLIVLVWIWLHGAQAWQLFESICLQLVSLNNLILLAAYLLVLRPFSFIISMALKRWQTSVNSSLPSAGHLIGLTERTLILTFVLIEQYAGIGFLLAAKSIFRFGDLTQQHDRQLTEYVMLGTLLSTVMTILLGLATQAMLV